MFQQLLPGHTGTSVIRINPECVTDPALNPVRTVRFNPHFHGDAVRLPEADAPDFLRQPVGILPDQPDRLPAVGPVQLHTLRRRNAEGLEEHGHFCERPVLGIGICNLLRRFLPDPGNFSQPFRVIADDLQGFFSEMLNELRRCFLSDSLHNARRQESLNTALRGGKDHLRLFESELLPVFRV